MTKSAFGCSVAFRLAIALALGLLGAASGACAAPTDCPRAGTLGTSRVLTLDAATTPPVGLKIYPQALPLEDKEVVLTFDDGPNPPTTRRVLAALAHECVQATFFLIGRSTAAYPELARTLAAEGHSVGHHSWSHPNMAKTPEPLAKEDITRGIDADDAALGTPAAGATAFFRFPYFASTRHLIEDVQQRHMVVFGADLWASDWNEMTPRQELDLITKRLQIARKGIILFHDSKARTAAMLPDFLRFLRDNGYRVVHVVPAGAPSEPGPVLDRPR